MAAQRIFQDRQRTPDSGERLGADDQDCGKVAGSKSEMTHPAPARGGTDPHQRHTCHHEQHENEMNEKNQICEQQIQCRFPRVMLKRCRWRRGGAGR